jgi:hypothetical protein
MANGRPRRTLTRSRHSVFVVAEPQIASSGWGAAVVAASGIYIAHREAAHRGPAGEGPIVSGRFGLRRRSRFTAVSPEPSDARKACPHTSRGYRS